RRLRTTSIRKLLAAGTGTVALCAVIAFALAPVTVLAEGTHQWGFWRGAALSFKSSTPTAVTLSPECSAALQTIKAAHDQDRIEDAQERVAAAQAGADPAPDGQEDKDERAANEGLGHRGRAACRRQR